MKNFGITALKEMSLVEFTEYFQNNPQDHEKLLRCLMDCFYADHELALELVDKLPFCEAQIAAFDPDLSFDDKETIYE